MNRYFITGTDTDCGKTYVTGKLQSFFSDAIAIKPVASGCIRDENNLVSTDALYLQKYNHLSLDKINPWRFSLPVSPHIAARRDGSLLNIYEIADYCMGFQLENKNTLFIEGAGGLMVPLNEKESWIDFLKITHIPVIIVVGMKLGCINHALLTQTALSAHNIPCAGWIANCLDPEMLMIEENIVTLIDLLKFPLLARVPFAGDISDVQLSSISNYQIL